MGARSRARLDALIARHPETFGADASHNLAFAFPRYLGPEGADGFARDSPAGPGSRPAGEPVALAPGRVPTDRLRIGLGRAGAVPALDALDRHLRVPVP